MVTNEECAVSHVTSNEAKQLMVGVADLTPSTDQEVPQLESEEADDLVGIPSPLPISFYLLLSILILPSPLPFSFYFPFPFSFSHLIFVVGDDVIKM